MKKRVPLYELINKLDSKEKIFIRKYIIESLNASSKEKYLDFYDILIKTKELSDENILHKLSKNRLTSYLPEAKFYLNKLIVKALRIHYTIIPSKKNANDNFLSNLEKQKEIYIYFSKGLYKDAALLCKKYTKDWEEANNFAMLSFAYKKMHQIELLTAKNQTIEKRYNELYVKLHNVNAIKSNYYNLSLKVESELNTNSEIRTKIATKKFENYLNTKIMTTPKSEDIYFWYIQILCHFALLNFKAIKYCFEGINRQISKTDTKEMEIVNLLQLFSRLTFISIYLDDHNYYYQYKSKYFYWIAKSTFLTEMHKNMYQLNAMIIESLFLFKQSKYDEMLKIAIPKLDIDNYIFEGTIMLHYVDLLFARGKANFKLLNFEKSYDYLNFIIVYKAKLKAKAFVICNAFFHIWLIRYLSNEYKVLSSIANRYKIFLSNKKINFPLEKALLKFMHSSSRNYSKENITRNAKKLMKTLEELSKQSFEKLLIDKLDILLILRKLSLAK